MNTKHQTPNTKHQTPNTKHQTPNTKHQTPNTKHQTPNTSSSASCQFFQYSTFHHDDAEIGNHLTPVEQNAVLIGGVSRPLLPKKR